MYQALYRNLIILPIIKFLCFLGAYFHWKLYLKFSFSSFWTQIRYLWNVFTHVANIFVNLLEKKETFTPKTNPTPTEMVWNTKMAAMVFFWKTNMATVTSCVSALFHFQRNSAAYLTNLVSWNNEDKIKIMRNHSFL